MSSESMAVVIGVDGGGTGCRAAIARADGAVMATASGGPANVTTDAGQACASVLSAIEAAAERAGLTPQDIAGATAYLGLAGVIAADMAEAVAQRLPFSTCVVTDDRAISLAGALGGRDGILLALGTGAIIASRRGETVRHVGGWGLKLSDQASGGWLGRSLLEEVLMRYDGLGAHTALTRATLAEFGDAPGHIVRFAVTAQPADFARLAPRIVEAAAAGDEAGLALMRKGAAYLERALEALEMGEDDILCLTGGVGPHYERYLAPRRRAAVRPASGSALDGALRLAAALHRQGRGAP